ncbi:hypothetical protein NDU88_005988 [Pleurodeles waltl]|uniref:Secreted protein n=1 Tax=Pleurodeles waltl TaxID=8319 RepID=A0AAV7UK72_PLEWA|nr:hypothetical protein NDU88_005988 [Pleurodeles waltl]
MRAYVLYAFYFVACDGPALPGPSVKAACAVAATSNPELSDGTTSPLGVPGLKGQWRPVHAPEREEKERRRTAEGEERTEEAGGSRKEDERQTRKPVKSQDANGGRDQMKRAPEVSAVLTATQEAHREASSHASGEACPTQVRP